MTVHIVENFANRPATHRTLSEHILLSHFCFHFQTSKSCPFLSAVVLFLHQQIKFIKAVHPRPVLLLIIFQRFQKANHRHTAFVFQLFHLSFEKALCVNLLGLNFSVRKDTKKNMKSPNLTYTIF